MGLIGFATLFVILVLIKENRHVLFGLKSTFSYFSFSIQKGQMIFAKMAVVLVSSRMISIGFATVAVIIVFSLVFRRIRSATAGNAGTNSSSVGEYKVYLSFSYEDTGKILTDFLHIFLEKDGIPTFKKCSDESSMREELDPKVRKAIEESKIFIPIFSQNYASLPGCLSELALSVECRARGQKIFPIFFDAKPSNVREQTGCYEEAFGQHRKLFDRSTVQEWENAMRQVVRLNGPELTEATNGYQGKLVEIVRERVLKELRTASWWQFGWN